MRRAQHTGHAHRTGDAPRIGDAPSAPAPSHLVDAHVHLMTPGRTASGLRWIRKVVPDYGALPEGVTADELLQDLEAAGAEAVFSFFYPLRGGESHAINRWQREFADRHPGVVPFASVHAEDEDPAGVVAQALGSLDLAGLKLHPYVQNLDPLDPRLAPALTATQDAGRPLVVHTGFARFYDREPLTEAVFELARRYPRLRVVLAHLVYPDLPLRAWPERLARFPNLYLDATNVLSLAPPGTPDGDALSALLERYSERFVFGSDYPMGMAYPVGKLYPLARAIAPGREALENLCWRTAASLVGPRYLPPALRPPR